MFSGIEDMQCSHSCRSWRRISSQLVTTNTISENGSVTASAPLGGRTRTATTARIEADRISGE